MNYTDVINRYTRYDTKLIVDSPYINWQFFKNSTILITGATGFIGIQLVLSIAKASMDFNLDIKLILPVRNQQKAKQLFGQERLFNKIKIIKYDINKKINYKGNIDYIIHTVSNTSSKSFVETPVETINTTILGTKNILEFAKNNRVKSLVCLSSMEVYGIVNSDTPLKESEYNYLDLLNERNSYPQAKRVAETMCYSYFKEYNVPVKIARLSQIIGANIPYDDNRVFVQLARNVIEKKDIILQTDGSTIRNYCYITDCISAIFTILERGVSGESYNVTNQYTKLSIREMAEKIKEYGENINIKYDLKADNKYLPKLKLLLATDKLEKINWHPEINVEKMLSKLVDGLLFQKNKSLHKYNLKTYIKKYINFKNFGGYKNIYFLGLKLRIPNNFIYNHLYKYLPIQKNKIIMINFSGLGYACNPKYITKKLLNENKKYKIIWLISNDLKKTNKFPKNVKLVNFSSERAIYELSTAKIWVSNVRLINLIKRGLNKKQEQKYIQTWHGALGIKKIDKDANPNFWKNSNWQNYHIKDSDMMDYLISNSPFETNVYKNAISNTAEIKELGHPRNDIFFQNNTEIKTKIYSKYNIEDNTKILLYAPTFRDNKHISCYNIDYESLLIPLSKKFGGTWKIFIRLHPRLLQYKEILVPDTTNIIDVTSYPDIQELLTTVDCTITDYSSCIFDFLLTKNPGFIYATDIKDYNHDRGFYYPLQKTPFPIAENNNELIQNILNFNYDDYIKNVEKFLIEKRCMDNGHASEKVVKLIDEIINEDK